MDAMRAIDAMDANHFVIPTKEGSDCNCFPIYIRAAATVRSLAHDKVNR